MFDWVKCSHCGNAGTVELGSDICPVCKKDGYLAWVNDDKQEVEDEIKWEPFVG